MSVFEVVQGVEGCCLLLDNERIAGPKPWGGGRVIRSWTTRKKYGELGDVECECDVTIEWKWTGPITFYEHELSCDHVITSVDNEPPNFCEECGARVRKAVE